MAEPWTFDFNAQDQIFTFSNGQVTFTVDTHFDVPPPPPPQLLPESVTVDTVSLTTPHDPVPVELGITQLEVPPPVIEHVAPHFLPDLPI
jgi:hypothetical protein